MKTFVNRSDCLKEEMEKFKENFRKTYYSKTQIQGATREKKLSNTEENEEVLPYVKRKARRTI